MKRVKNLVKVKIDFDESKALNSTNDSLPLIYPDQAIFKLMNFHVNRQKELALLAEKFNILFYGYGEKSVLLNTLFPKTPSINCIGKTDLDILQEMSICLTDEELHKPSGFGRIKERVLYLNNFCSDRKQHKIVLVDPSLSFLSLIKDVVNLTVIVSHNKYAFKYTKRRLIQNKFVLIDLTTFIPYENIDEIVPDFNKSISFDILKVMSNVPEKSKNVFIEILKLCAERDCKTKNFVVELVPFLEIIKQKFLISKVNVLNQHLLEFIEHDILKQVVGGFKCLFSSEDSKEVLKDL
ncbi:hypothetical protein CDIK_0112 [Cucumispora dikerogammari]|nr:hypothetical protein CDIK_0112 [Cucumispora dikerogammari]